MLCRLPRLNQFAPFFSSALAEDDLWNAAAGYVLFFKVCDRRYNMSYDLVGVSSFYLKAKTAVLCSYIEESMSALMINSPPYLWVTGELLLLTL